MNGTRVGLPTLSYYAYLSSLALYLWQGFYIGYADFKRSMEFDRKGGHILSSNVVKKTEDLVLPILEEQNFELVDIEYTKEGSNWYLRVYIDKDGGIEIDECGLVSEKLSEELDKADPIKDPYFLEVSSPGVERPLKTKEDLKKHVNSYVNVRLYEKIENDKEFEGTIQSFENDVLQLEIKIKTRKKVIEIPYEKIAKARLAVSF